METLGDALAEAARLLWQRDPETVEILLRSLRVSLLATAIACAVALPFAYALAFGRFRGRRPALAVVNTGLGLPPVVVGLVVTVFLWRSGPLGGLGLLYTTTGMVIAQALIAAPLVCAFATAALQGGVDPDLRLQLRGLGATRLRLALALVREARLGLLAAAMAGFGAALSEVGAAMMVGGNIAGETRVLTTGAVLATSRGDFDLALALGLVLLLVAFAVTAVLTALQQRAAPLRS
jgi:tungstate transport system permease protein